MKARDMEYVVFDVETTGLSPLNGDRVIEIAAVKVRDGQEIDVFESLINPQRPLNPGAQRVNNISEDMVAAAPTADEVLPRMIDFIGGACVAGHNVKFDLDFLCYELSLSGRKLRDETPAIDTLKMAKEFLPHLTSYRLSNVGHSLGFTFEETHRALADVRLTVSILNRLVMIAHDRRIESFRKVVKHFSVQKPVFRMERVSQEMLF